MSWAFHCAHTTAQTYGFLDHCTVVFYFYRTGCAGLLADSTADTADVTLLLCFCTFFLIGTFYHNVVCTLMDMDHFLWADFAQAPQPMHFSSSTSATPYSLMEMAPNLHLSIQLYIRYIHLHSRPHLRLICIPHYMQLQPRDMEISSFTAIFSTSFHMVFRSEEDYIVFHHSI